jgi:hypothetical protein
MAETQNNNKSRTLADYFVVGLVAIGAGLVLLVIATKVIALG